MKRVLMLVAALAGVLALAACGSSSSSSSASSSASSSGSSSASSSAPAAAATTSSSATSVAAAGSCGSIPQQMPADPDGVLAKLPASTQAAYDLFPQAVHASAWSHWKPTHKAPYTLYFSPGNTSTPFIQDLLAQFKVLKAKSGVIGKIITQDANNNVQTQIQQIQQAIQQKVDIMVVLPLSPAADAPVLEAAGKAGIPVVAPLNAASSPYVVGLNGNLPLEGAKLAQGFVSALGAKGNVLDVHGIPGVEADSGIYEGVNDVLKSCPNIKTIGSIVGLFTPSVAKTATLEFLTSHPQPIDGAVQTGGMATGIIQAFLQTGRKVPVIADDGATPGALAYWAAHRSTYKGVALGIAPAAATTATWNVVLGLLSGRGIKISDISTEPLIVTASNLSQWVQPGWSLTTPIAYAQGPANLSFYPPSYLDQFFVKPASGTS
jgi:ribose transport system substrate-binding protein